jgi:hypothetical protein
MTKTLAFLCTAFLCASPFAFAQNEQELPSIMKGLAVQLGKARKDAAAKANTDLGADAQQLEDSYKKVGAILTKLKIADAAKMAKANELAAKDLGAAAKAGDAVKIDASLATINSGCGSCHMAHREKNDDGTYRIK